MGQVEVFVSSHDIISGERWFERLEEELSDAKVLLALCSGSSVLMPWINFEAGAAYFKGIPIISVCHSGLTVETLPIPLRFFQGLDAETEEFTIKAMGDLAQHLGYDRTPAIRYEDMTAEVREALSQIGQQSGQVAQDEMGYVDHLVLVMDKMGTLGNLISDFEGSTNEITVETQRFGDEARRAGDNPSSGTPRHLQRIARRFGKHLDAYAGRVEELNRKYALFLPEIESSLQYVLTYKPPETSSDWEGVDEFLDTLDGLEQAVSQWKSAVLTSREPMKEMAQFQGDLRKGAGKTSEQLDILIANLDNTLDMTQRVRSTLRRIEWSQ